MVIANAGGTLTNDYPGPRLLLIGDARDSGETITVTRSKDSEDLILKTASQSDTDVQPFWYQKGNQVMGAYFVKQGQTGYLNRGPGFLHLAVFDEKGVPVWNKRFDLEKP